MKKKTLGILVCMLLIASALIPLVNSMKVDSKNISVPILGYEGVECGQVHCISVLQDLDKGGYCEVDEWIGTLWFIYEGGLTCAENYDYHWDDACAHPVNAPIPLEERQSRWYFYHGSDGLSLGIIHDKKDSSYGGNVDLTIDVAQGFLFQEDADVCVSDDPYPRVDKDEFYETTPTSNHFIGNWAYSACCTDGGVIGDLTCDAMRIDVEPGNWDNIQKWHIYGPDLDQNHVFIDLDLSLKTCFLCGWDNCIVVDKKVKIEGEGDDQYRDTADLWSHHGSCVGRIVIFKISVCVCEHDPEINIRSIDIPFSCLWVTDVLPSGLEYIKSTPPYTDDPSPGEYVWDLGQIEQGRFLPAGDCYDILIWAKKSDPIDSTNWAKATSSCPPGCSTSVFDEDTATVICTYTKSNIEVTGSLDWADIEPGGTVTGSFQVMNVGDEGSELNWEITSYPNWGTWTITPSSGTALKPEDGPVEVDVEVEVPDEKNEEFSGEVKIVNKDDPTDNCTIPVSLTTPKNKATDIHSLFLRFLENHPQLFPILRQLLLKL